MRSKVIMLYASFSALCAASIVTASSAKLSCAIQSAATSAVASVCIRFDGLVTRFGFLTFFCWLDPFIIDLVVRAVGSAIKCCVRMQLRLSVI